MKPISKQTKTEKQKNVKMIDKLNADLAAQMSFNNGRKDALLASIT